MENYHSFYDQYLQAHPELEKESFEGISRKLYEQMFYQADSYAYAARELGYDAGQVIPTCRSLQERWGAEHGMSFPPRWLSSRPWRWWWTRIAGKPHPKESFYEKILLKQLEEFRPDLLYIFTGAPITSSLLARAREFCSRIVIQWTCLIDPSHPFHLYDEVVSCARNFVEDFRSMEVPAAFCPHAFDERVLNKIRIPANKEGAVFVGSLSALHRHRIEILDQLSRQMDFDFYGMGVECLLKDSPLRKYYRGPVFGLPMYEVFSRCRVVIHASGDATLPAAGAKRLFEATGAGAFLLTEDQLGLGEFFEVGKEVETFSSVEECAEKVRYFLSHDSAREAIAKAGQTRTLRDHTFRVRMPKLMEILENVIEGKGARETVARRAKLV